MKEHRPERAGIGLSMLRVAFRSRQASHRLLRIRSASMTQFDGMSSEHHPLLYGAFQETMLNESL
ncbi:hypothetical protein [Ralstonia pseudosolanacearum]|uniref:hypothetical protein n=1 Tax=Ralstonia pseudosolanacearum TaxID=1310165 RepID=UPI00220238A0|nr:hypothetical protein NHF34_18765 [Ralstonia solanacearum]